MPIEDIVTLANGGAIMLLTAAVVALWRRLNSVTDKFTEYLQDRAENGDHAALRTIVRHGDYKNIPLE